MKTTETMKMFMSSIVHSLCQWIPDDTRKPYLGP